MYNLMNVVLFNEFVPPEFKKREDVPEPISNQSTLIWFLPLPTLPSPTFS